MNIVRLRRKEAGGATLVELTVVLVILGLLALTQLNGGLQVLERVRHSTASMQPASPRAHSYAPLYQRDHAPPAAQAPGSWTGNPARQTASLRPSNHLPSTTVREKLTGVFHRAADWLEKPSRAEAAHSGGQEEKRFCIGRLCV